MNKQHIQDLLDKYFEGETSLYEEKELKNFFRKTELLPEEWKSYKLMFGYFETEGMKRMPVKNENQRRKNFFWLAGIGISLAASVLILLTVFLQPTRKQLEPFANATKKLEQNYAVNPQNKKTQPTKSGKTQPVKNKKLKGVPVRKLLDDDASNVLANNRDHHLKQKNFDEVIDASLSPLDNMKVVNNAMDKFKYFDLMNKYLPDQDLSTFTKTKN